MRNQEIEHPNPNTFVTVGGHAWHNLYGPRARSKRSGGALVGTPPGWMFTDAAELESCLRQALTSALTTPLPQQKPATDSAT
jgi:hypothetical protein